MAMSPQDLSQDCPLGLGSQSYRDLDGFLEPGRGARLHSTPRSRTPGMETEGSDDFAAVGRSPLLKTLMDAEGAANCAAIQLMSFTETLDDDFADSGHLASYSRRLLRQRNLLLDKLEVFKQINKTVGRQLKELQESEANRIETNKYIDIVLKKLAQAEGENLLLKSELSHKEKQVAELRDLRKKEMDNTESVVQMSRSVAATRAHLQGQLRNKEGDNNRMTVQLRGVERSLTEQKLQNDALRREMSSLSAKAAHEKEALKKAARAQKRRAERFEAAVDKCYAQLREKDVQLLETRAERDSWRRQQERSIEDRVEMDSRMGLLKGQIADMTEKLQRERGESTAANEVLLQRVERLNTEHEDLNLDNATLKAAVAGMERQLACSAAALEEQSAVSQERKAHAERGQSQVAELQAEVDDLRMKLKSLLRAKEIREERDVESEKMDSQAKKLSSSLEMKDSIHEANSHLRERLESLQRRTEELQQEKEELEHRLAGQQEALQYNSRHLEQSSAECQALNRQLEAALVDVRLQVTRVKEKAVSREGDLQTKILELEAEKSRRENEFKQLKHSKQYAEKQFDIRLKDLQLSLDRSERHKQSIQNYVDFLKNSYATMFDEGLPPPSFGSSYFFN